MVRKARINFEKGSIDRGYRKYPNLHFIPHCIAFYDFYRCLQGHTSIPKLFCRRVGKDQESTHSSTTPDPGHVMGK